MMYHCSLLSDNVVVYISFLIIRDDTLFLIMSCRWHLFYDDVMVWQRDKRLRNHTISFWWCCLLICFSWCISLYNCFLMMLGLAEGCKAPQAAGVIHTDFERGFIMAETMAFSDLKELGSESEVKANGEYRCDVFVARVLFYSEGCVTSVCCFHLHRLHHSQNSWVWHTFIGWITRTNSVALADWLSNMLRVCLYRLTSG